MNKLCFKSHTPASCFLFLMCLSYFLQIFGLGLDGRLILRANGLIVSH